MNNNLLSPAVIFAACLLTACATPPPRQSTFSGMGGDDTFVEEENAYRHLHLAVIMTGNAKSASEYTKKMTGKMYGRSIDGSHLENIRTGLVPTFRKYFGKVLRAATPAAAAAKDIDMYVVVDLYAKYSSSIFSKTFLDIDTHFFSKDREKIDQIKVAAAVKPKGLGFPAVNRAINGGLAKGIAEFEKGLRASVKLKEFAGRVSPRTGPTSAPSVARALRRPKIVSDIDTPGFKHRDDPKNFAVVIGVEDYRNLPKADYAGRDAQAVHAHLRAAGYPERNIIQLRDQRATISDMKKYIEEWLPKNIHSDSTLFFYFSGHGAPNPVTGEAYLVPWDGDAKFLTTTGYPLKKLYASLSGLKAKRIFVALDACFSGAGGRSVLAKGARPLVMKVETGLKPSSRLTLLTAASGDEITGTLESQGHGLFTYFLLKGLNGAAKDRRGRVTVQGVYDYLKPKVQDEARRDNREQSPVIAGPSRESVLLRLK